MIVESGEGLVDSNSYVSLEDAENYFLERLYIDTWGEATDSEKEASLIMGTRSIDINFEFRGEKTNGTQALKFPRSGITIFSYEVPSNSIPILIKNAVCEMALSHLKNDQYSKAESDVTSIKLGGGAIGIDFSGGDVSDTEKVISMVRSMLTDYTYSRNWSKILR